VAVIDGRNWLERLNQRDCWQFLATTPVGRIGVLNDSAPEIYPVNHVVDGHTIVFRTEPGTKLRGLLRSPAVCYEVDGLDPATAAGWSVLIKGRATEVHDPQELRHLAELPLEYWALGDKHHWIRITPTEVTGRRIWRPPPAGGESAEGSQT